MVSELGILQFFFFFLISEEKKKRKKYDAQRPTLAYLAPTHHHVKQSPLRSSMAQYTARLYHTLFFHVITVYAFPGSKTTRSHPAMSRNVQNAKAPPQTVAHVNTSQGSGRPTFGISTLVGSKGAWALHQLFFSTSPRSDFLNRTACSSGITDK